MTGVELYRGISVGKGEAGGPFSQCGVYLCAVGKGGLQVITE